MNVNYKKEKMKGLTYQEKVFRVIYYVIMFFVSIFLVFVGLFFLAFLIYLGESFGETFKVFYYLIIFILIILFAIYLYRKKNG